MARSQNKLIDSFARNAIKLRISITDRCNMRCVYCMPTNNNEWFEQKNILAYALLHKSDISKLNLELSLKRD